MLPFFKQQMDRILYKIQLDFVSGERTSFAEFFDMMQCIFDVKIGLELPFGANDHQEGEYQLDILLATVQSRHQLATQGNIMDCLSELRAGSLCKMDQCLFSENLLRIQIGSAKYAQRTLEPKLKHISGKRSTNIFCRRMPSIYVD
jgi:hypothetical protein